MERRGISQKELERLVEQVVREVLALLLGASGKEAMDFSHYRLLAEADITRARAAGYRILQLGERTIITPLAMDEIKKYSLTIRR